MAIAGLVLGIVGICTFWLCGFGIIPGILGIVFGALGRKETGPGGKAGRGMATAGLVTGVIAVVLVVLLFSLGTVDIDT